MVEAADYGPDYQLDVLKEIQESWILLMPGDFYGGKVQLQTAPVSPGTYKVAGRRCPPRLSNELRRQLACPEIPSTAGTRRLRSRLPEGREVAAQSVRRAIRTTVAVRRRRKPALLPRRGIGILRVTGILRRLPRR